MQTAICYHACERQSDGGPASQLCACKELASAQGKQKVQAAIYWRYACGQPGRDDVAQVRVCEEYAVSEKLEIVDVYGDPGRSGRSAHARPGLQRLMADVRAQRFDVIIVRSLDRCFRDQVELATFFAELAESGVTLISVTEGTFDFTTLFGRLYSAMEKWYVRVLAGACTRNS